MFIVRPPLSKSDAHRALVAQALAIIESGDRNCLGDFNNPSESEDLRATRCCLEKMIVAHGNQNFGNTGKGILELFPGESGSTLRFLLPVCGALGISVDFIPDEGLYNRPIGDLMEVMNFAGCQVEKSHGRISVRGRLTPGIFKIKANVSSQYITGLMLALPLLKKESLIAIYGEPQSEPYIELTRSVLADFGIHIDGSSYPISGIPKQDCGMCLSRIYRISGEEVYQGNPEYMVEADWSNSAVWLALGVTGDEPVRVDGLNMDSRQGDKRMVDLIKRFGGRISVSGDCVTALPSSENLSGIEIDASNIPDLVPVLAFIAALASGRTIIRRIERLRLKESNRILTICKTLEKAGVRVEATYDSLLIYGCRNRLFRCGRYDSFNDHRIVMLITAISTRTDGPVGIENWQAIRKSYPDFFDKIKENGGIRWLQLLERI